MIPRCGLILTVLCILAAGDAAAQTATVKPGSGKAKGKGANAPEVKRLDTKMEEVRESFLRDTTNLIYAYENIGQFERAKVLLESLQKLDPKNEPIRAKLGELNAKIVETSEFEVDIDPEKSWQPIGAVAKDRTLRIRVAGECKISLIVTAGPEGVPTGNPAEDLVANVPLGAVVGVIATPGFGGPAGAGGEKPPRPFAVGANYERPADRDGVLYLRVNVPAGAKCTGRLSAKVSGPERPAP